MSQLHAADANFESTHFSGSANCSQCHDGLRDEKGKDISIVKNWSTSMMANATRDPYWRAKVASELHRNPSVSDEINDKCSRCHAPMANEAMKKRRRGGQYFWCHLWSASHYGGIKRPWVAL